MASGNGSFGTEFLLLGLKDQPDLQSPLFFLFLVTYNSHCVGKLGHGNFNRDEFTSTHPHVLFPL